MNQFSLGNAWSKGVGFFGGQPAMHALILIVVGILVPAALQLLIAGGLEGMANPLAMGQAGLGGLTALGGLTVLLVMAAGYVLGIGSYFGSWRLGLGAGEDTGGAIVYGLIAGLLVVILFVGLIVLFGVLMSQASVTVGAILFIATMMLLLSAIYTAMAALVAVGMFLMLLLMLAFGATMNAIDPGMGLGEGGGAVAVVIGLGLAVLLLWLSARFCCVAPAMADRRSLNLALGFGESWRLTAEHQWRIMGYLALLGIVLVVILFVLSIVVGAGMVAGMGGGGGPPQVGAGAMILGLLFGIPFAYLVVLVPAGIYRELRPAAPAEVFV